MHPVLEPEFIFWNVVFFVLLHFWKKAVLDYRRMEKQIELRPVHDYFKKPLPLVIEEGPDRPITEADGGVIPFEFNPEAENGGDTEIQVSPEP